MGGERGHREEHRLHAALLTNIQNKYVMTTTIMKVDSVAIEPC